MFEGKILCVGSSLFVKNKYGLGYHLRIDIASQNSAKQISELVSDKICSPTLDRVTNNEMLFTLPKCQTDNFAGLFDSLDQSIERNNFGIKAYGISMTTLEDVFLNICRRCEHPNEVVQSTDAFSTLLRSTQFAPNLKQKVSILIKIRCLILLRNRTYLCGLAFQLGCILIYCCSLLLFLKPVVPSPFALTSEVYEQNTIIFKSNTISSEMIASFSKHWNWKAVPEFTFELMKDAIYAVDLNQKTATIIFKANYSHSLPILQNCISNILASLWLNQSLLIETVNHPFEEDHFSLSKLAYLMSYIGLSSLGLYTLAVNFAVEVVQERKVSHLA